MYGSDKPNNRLFITLLSLVIISSFSLPVYAEYDGGTGTPEDPYQIATAADLILLGETPGDYDKYFIMTADIDLDPNLPGGKVFDRAVIAPDMNDTIHSWGVSFEGTPFAGVFNGDGHIISSLAIKGVSYLGLFGELASGASIANLGLEAVRISGVGNRIGGMAGRNGDWDQVAGTLSNCYCTGTVSGNDHVGGLVGWNDDNGSIASCFSNCTVSGHESVGGLVGYNSRGNISTSFSSSVVSGDYHVGGLAGRSRGTISTSFSRSTVSGDWHVGGLVGSDSGEITTCYSSGSVAGDRWVGGLVGESPSGIIVMSYSSAAVVGSTYIGGLVGEDSSSSWSGGSIVNCFWDTEVSGQTESDGGGAGNPTVEMYAASTFAAWGTCGNQGTWTIDEGRDYPRLWWEEEDGLFLASSTLDELLEGDGIPGNPYLIETAEQLELIGLFPCDYGKHFKLVADIDLDPNLPGGKVYDRAVIAPQLDQYKWYPSSTPFTGVFDGNGHTISHLTITGGRYLGLFGKLAPEAIVINLGLESVHIESTDLHVGGIAGCNRGTVVSSYSTGMVSGVESVGGLVGQNGGGLIGVGMGPEDNGIGHIYNCYSTAKVSGMRHGTGGLVGRNARYIVNSYSTGLVTIEEDWEVGGLVGCEQIGAKGGTTINCFWDTQTSGQSESRGGTGLTTVNMTDVQTFLDAGWDFVGQISDGLCEIWQVSESGYPVLSTFNGYEPPQLTGRGTAQEPHLIYTARDLGAVYYHPGAYHRLMSPIDLANITWRSPVIPAYAGNFDGNGLIIDKLTISGEDPRGLFGVLGEGARVIDLGLIHASVTGSGDLGLGIGILAGVNHGRISGCFSQGEVIGYGSGLVGNNGGDITACYSNADVIGGGLVGSNYSYLRPYGKRNGTISMSYSTGKVSGEDSGLVSYRTYGDITASFWDIETSGQAYSGGGMGLTTTQMMDAEIYRLNGWAGSPHWVLDNGEDYPRLAWEGTPGDPIPEPTLDWIDGIGTVAEPYQVWDASQLILIGQASILWDKHFRLMADVDLSGVPWSRAVVPIFSGSFDGNGFAIRGLTVTGTDYLGLFGKIVAGAKVHDLEVANVDILSTRNRIGGLAGQNDGIVTGCNSTGTITGDTRVGGLVGYNTGSIATSYSTGEVNGDHSIGGFVGHNGHLDRGSVEMCYSTGTVSGGERVGGFVGENRYGSIVMSYSTGVMSGDDQIGGFVGFGGEHPSVEKIQASFWDIQTSGQTSSDGGTGLTSAQMRTVSTFLEAGWDFVDETDNGTDDVWWIDEGQGYPRLWWELDE
jgi:mucin-19